MVRGANYPYLVSSTVIGREPNALPDRQTIAKGQYTGTGKAFPMSTSLAQDKTSTLLAATDDRLRREMSELQKLREAVAEAERRNPDLQQRPEPRPLS